MLTYPGGSTLQIGLVRVEGGSWMLPVGVEAKGRVDGGQRRTPS